MGRLISIIKGGYVDSSVYTTLLARYNKCQILKQGFGFVSLNKFAGSVLFLPSETEISYDAVQVCCVNNELVFICYHEGKTSSMRVMLLREDGLYKVLSFKPSNDIRVKWGQNYKISDSCEIHLLNKRYKFSLKYAQGYRELKKW